MGQPIVHRIFVVLALLRSISFFLIQPQSLKSVPEAWNLIVPSPSSFYTSNCGKPFLLPEILCTCSTWYFEIQFSLKFGSRALSGIRGLRCVRGVCQIPRIESQPQPESWCALFMKEYKLLLFCYPTLQGWTSAKFLIAISVMSERDRGTCQICREIQGNFKSGSCRHPMCYGCYEMAFKYHYRQILTYGLALRARQSSRQRVIRWNGTSTTYTRGKKKPEARKRGTDK